MLAETHLRRDLTQNVKSGSVKKCENGSMERMAVNQIREGVEENQIFAFGSVETENLNKDVLAKSL